MNLKQFHFKQGDRKYDCFYYGPTAIYYRTKLMDINLTEAYNNDENVMEFLERLYDNSLTIRLKLTIKEVIKDLRRNYPSP